MDFNGQISMMVKCISLLLLVQMVRWTSGQIPGPTGPVGPRGPSGPMGEAGSPGPAGAPGPPGNAGLPGPSNVQGALAGGAGRTGATGQRGPSNGATGYTGATGRQGLRGLPGEAGPVGPPGKVNLLAPGEYPSTERLSTEQKGQTPVEDSNFWLVVGVILLALLVLLLACFTTYLWTEVRHLKPLYIQKYAAPAPSPAAPVAQSKYIQK